MIWVHLLWKGRREGFSPAQLERIRSFLGLGEHGSERPLLQHPDNYLPGLSSKAWYNADEFDWIPRLTNAFPAVRRELQGVIPGGGFHQHETGLATRGQWKVFYLYYVGRKVEANCVACPRTTELVESIPGHEVGLAYFSRLAPGGELTPHCGPRNVALRCHLGLKVPEYCGIQVADEIRAWEEGECLVFDDSFEHRVWNNSRESRYVLIVDFFHPEVSVAEKWAFQQIMQMSWMARRRFRRLETV